MHSNGILKSINIAELLNDASIDRVMAVDKDWKIIAWNTASEQRSGIDRSNVLGRQLLDVFPQLKEDFSIIEGIRAAMNGLTYFLPAVPNQFNRDKYENHFSPLRDEQGAIHGVMVIMHDVSHRIKAETQLRQLNDALQEKIRQVENVNSELATFTSIAGNDLKNPIRKMYTSLESIIKTEGALLSDQSKAGLRRMQSSLNRINLLLDDILALSNASSLSSDVGEVDLNRVFDAAVNKLSSRILEKNAAVTRDQLPPITASAQMMQYLFLNIISNGIKFQDHGAVPKIHVSAESSFRESHSAVKGAYTCLHFQDNGIGFDQSQSEEIFRMFHCLHARTRFPGSGIGLSVSQKIAESHGGFIEVKSNPGEGSLFTVCLPMKHDMAPAEAGLEHASVDGKESNG